MENLLWIILAVLFFILFGIHFFLAFKKFPEYYPKDITVSKINGISTGVPEFMNGFNNYIKDINASNKKKNFIAAIGYLLASTTCVVSYLI